MNKVVCFVVCCIAVLLLTACGNKITVKGEDGTEYESYQECCAAQDFQAAHQFIAKMQNDEDYISNYNSAKEYVFKQEALYLMSQGDETAKKRIVYLLKEEGDNIKHVEMLMDLAIENDDEAFVKTLVNQFQKGYNGKGITSMIDYLSKKNTEEAKDYIRKYATDHFSLGNTVLVDFFVATNEKEDADFVMGKIIEKENSIKKRPKLGKTTTNDSEFDDTCKDYSSSVKQYNGLCQKILGMTIKNKNLYLAQRVVSKFKTNIFWEQSSSFYKRPSFYYVYNVTVDTDDVNAAKKTLNDAIRGGAFK